MVSWTPLPHLVAQTSKVTQQDQRTPHDNEREERIPQARLNITRINLEILPRLWTIYASVTSDRLSSANSGNEGRSHTTLHHQTTSVVENYILCIYQKKLSLFSYILPKLPNKLYCETTAFTPFLMWKQNFSDVSRCIQQSCTLNQTTTAGSFTYVFFTALYLELFLLIAPRVLIHHS